MPRESTTGIYAGAFHRTMDAKNRVTVPSEWLHESGDVFFVLPALENLSVMPPEELGKQEEKINELLPVGPKRQEALRQLYSSARQIEPDKQGRILLPDEYCKKVGLSGEVTFLGVKNRFEIWSAAKRSAAAQKEPDTDDDVRKALEAIGL